MTILGSFIADKKYDRYFENFQDITKIFHLFLEDNSMNIFLIFMEISPGIIRNSSIVSQLFLEIKHVL